MVDNKQMHISKDHRAEQDALPQDHPLDPAVERVRKKLMRLMIISISITLILILAVLFGVVYKIIATGSAPKQTDPFPSHSTNQEIFHHTLFLSKNTQILSQSLSDHNIVLKILTPGGQTKFMIYNYHSGALIAVLSVETTEETSTTLPH
ncbi:putative membrane protein SpoIIM required for sporulation [Bartonella callosciuri]|uniref:Putative membrane protein SpoIIM required for sporulation n=1 Tax=Bartonella callosciuri TaxID=686223 RepID=A0A840NYB2_9HYPH|nr:hypothetical protein [Bartonella callosciuri]MBB5074342.1 putative membrane protein SpoIIM required for sporulation [Bartonella callosciuri]